MINVAAGCVGRAKVKTCVSMVLQIHAKFECDARQSEVPCSLFFPESFSPGLGLMRSTVSSSQVYSDLTSPPDEPVYCKRSLTLQQQTPQVHDTWKHCIQSLEPV